VTPRDWLAIIGVNSIVFAACLKMFRLYRQELQTNHTLREIIGLLEERDAMDRDLAAQVRERDYVSADLERLSQENCGCQRCRRIREERYLVN
jgi:hypothetical protein